MNDETLGTKANPIKHGGVPRGYKVCECQTCKRVAVCHPGFDFYTEPGTDEGPLFCEGCMRGRICKGAP